MRLAQEHPQSCAGQRHASGFRASIAACQTRSTLPLLQLGDLIGGIVATLEFHGDVACLADVVPADHATAMAKGIEYRPQLAMT
ncbi:hypothetical protein U1708_08095 [Sphingomonas sp. ZB1N12]